MSYIFSLAKYLMQGEPLKSRREACVAVMPGKDSVWVTLLERWMGPWCALMNELSSWNFFDGYREVIGDSQMGSKETESVFGVGLIAVWGRVGCFSTRLVSLRAFQVCETVGSKCSGWGVQSDRVTRGLTSNTVTVVSDTPSLCE